MKDLNKRTVNSGGELTSRDLEFNLAEAIDFIENASMPLHRVNSSGVIIWANRAELNLLGYAKDEYVGHAISDFHVDPETIADILTRLGNDDTLYNYPARLKHKDGSIKHVLINSNVWRKDGEFVHTRCFTRDISEKVMEEEKHRRLFEQLQESESRLRLAINSTKLGTWDWNSGRGKMYWSAECKEILGLHPDAHISFQEFLAQIDEADRSQVNDKAETIINNSSTEPVDISFRIRRIYDEDLRWVRIQGSIFFDQNGRLNRFIGTMLDITDAVQADQQNAHLAAIIASSNDAIVAKTTEGKITTWNSAAHKMFGYTSDEIVGESIMKIIPEDRKDEELHILSKLKNGESVEHFETKRLTKAGTLIDVSLTISPIRDYNGSIIGISKIARDITERKREEKRKNDFVAMVSHELKTPLTSILLYAQLLIKKSGTVQDDTFLNMSSKIEAYVKRMISMITDYLGLSRIEEGKMNLQKTRFELDHLALEVIEEASLISSKHSLELVSSEGVWVYADKEKMRQVLINLVSNAVKYSPQGGPVILGCERVAGKAQIYVKDKGLGISPADQNKLFQRFYRVDDDQIKNISGFGIGLYLVSELLRLHDSQILVKSEVGKGSVFYFYLDLD
ncbi:PAS domain-containing sensor histidine kinase [Sphingobacterium pedocola]|uniref:histidine kinase n=1 Tax=Sphingobacterium pedocola TaxID=2082722 RepID=A0ABR9T1Z9_9SPHI|nr:PAS domain S-box protein [Sphingobacterium pedocola]MBE8719369.1 hypothetical protein [Sphingobacterium pedocola]